MKRQIKVMSEEKMLTGSPASAEKTSRDKKTSKKSSSPNVIPSDFFEKIEFEKVRNLLISFCRGEQGRNYYKQLDLLKNLREIRDSLALSKEFHSAFERDKQIPMGDYYNIDNDLYLLSKENYMLDVEALFRINAVIRLGDEIYRYFKKDDELQKLSKLALKVPFDPQLSGIIDKVLDEEGNVRPNASPELKKISSKIQSKLRELDKEFDQVVKFYKEKNMLTDSVESYRNGRRVLSVPAENKRQIKGTIHDESATGKTVFLEPEPLIRLNNDLYEFENDKKTEINRIVRALCSDLRSYIYLIKAFQNLIVEFDIIGAKAKWAKIIDGQFPEIVNKPALNYKEAYHPILKLKNDEEDLKTVPFDLEMHGDNRILLLSGPNAGGKSILMKAVILLQTMVQCGIPIPVHPDSKPGFFKKFMADIGDQQSIENDLSTYSSRLKIMADSLRQANNHTLLVIDEFGSGTDPEFGGALAESMLNSFNKLGVFGVVTTHYSNLKIYAYKTKGIVNAAMVFNEDQLKPTYEMRVGKPGSSFALEIADKSGIPKTVMKYARYKTGKNTTKVEDLLVNLQREKAEIEAKLATIVGKELELQRLMNTYNQLHKELDVRRKKVKIEAKELSLRDTAEQNKAFEKLVRELREEKKLEEAKKIAAELKLKRETIHKDVVDLESSMDKQMNFDVSKFKEGDYVKIGSGRDVGMINWIRKSKAEVRIGNLAITTKLKDLIPAKEPIEINRTKSVRSSICSNSQTHTRLDIRGMILSDASRMIEEFLDKAILGNAHELTIVHGMGTGALRKEVKRIAKDYKDIKELYHPEFEAGGDGVSIIKL